MRRRGAGPVGVAVVDAAAMREDGEAAEDQETAFTPTLCAAKRVVSHVLVPSVT